MNYYFAFEVFNLEQTKRVRGIALRTKLRVIFCFIGIIVFAFGVQNPAVGQNSYVRVNETGREFQFEQFEIQFKRLLNELESERKRFETLEAHDLRVSNARRTLNSFRTSGVTLVSRPQRISIDWPNTIVHFQMSYPVNVARVRSMGKGSGVIDFAARLGPDTIREVETFPNHFDVSTQLRLSPNYQTFNLTLAEVRLNGKIIYVEK